MKKMLLLDINVWLALTFDSHIHHPAAKAWFDGLANEVCCFCRLTQQGFLRLATNPSVFGKHAVTLPEAWQKYDTFPFSFRCMPSERNNSLRGLPSSPSIGLVMSTYVSRSSFLHSASINAL